MSVADRREVAAARSRRTVVMADKPKGGKGKPGSAAPKPASSSPKQK